MFVINRSYWQSLHDIAKSLWTPEHHSVTKKIEMHNLFLCPVELQWLLIETNAIVHNHKIIKNMVKWYGWREGLKGPACNPDLNPSQEL